MVEWDEVVDSAIEAGAVVSVQNREGSLLCYAEGKLIMKIFN